MARITDKQQRYATLLFQLEKIGEAECSNNPDIFFPDDIHDKESKKWAVDLAQAICRDCPIKIQCAEYALAANEPYGIWGGLTPADRGH